MTTPPPFEVYLDFDNTLTPFDVVDAIIRDFSVDDEWKRIEEEWESGRIGSRECLERQFARLRVTRPALSDYLAQIPVEPALPELFAHLRARAVPFAILSDSCEWIIRRILAARGIEAPPIFANALEFDGDRLSITFPYFASICTRCGNCKTSHLMRRNRPDGTRKIYVGDGRSDVCPAGFCEVLFAKDGLYRHYAPLRPDCIQFDSLDTVLNHLKSLIP